MRFFPVAKAYCLCKTSEKLGSSVIVRFSVVEVAYRERKCADTVGTVLVPGLAISSAKMLIYCSNKIYGMNFIKYH